MDYKTKIKYAEAVAVQLENKEELEQIRFDLSAKGLNEIDINKVIKSSKNIIAEKYQRRIKACLLENKDIRNNKEFESLDKELIDKLIDREVEKLAVAELRKISKLTRQGISEDEILEQVDVRFISPDSAAEHVVSLREVKSQNSTGGTYG